MSRKNVKLFTIRERLSLIILINLTQMIVRVLDFADFRLELEQDLKELKALIKECHVDITGESNIE